MTTIEGDTFLLYLYGTLMRDGCRNKAISDQKFLREAETTAEYQLLDLGSFPGLVRVEEGGRKVKGELWEIHKSRIPLLDSIEGAPNMYRMESIHVEGETRPVYSYFFKLRSKNPTIYEGARWNNGRERRIYDY